MIPVSGEWRINMEYLSVRQIADKWGISPRRVQVLCNQNRIAGAMKIGYAWIVPAEAPKPLDARIKREKAFKEISIMEVGK